MKGFVSCDMLVEQETFLKIGHGVFDQLDPRPEEAPIFDDPSTEKRKQAAPGLVKLNHDDEIGPSILFPPDNAEIYVTNRGVALAARGGAGALSWYAEGAPIGAEETSGRIIWRPSGEGFYDVVVVDAEGRSATARVRVKKG